MAAPSVSCVRPTRGRTVAGRVPEEKARERARAGGEGESSAESRTFPQSGDLTHGSHTFHSLWPVGSKPVLSVRSTAWRRRCVCVCVWRDGVPPLAHTPVWSYGGKGVRNAHCDLNPLSTRVSVRVCAGVSVCIFRSSDVDKVCLV